MCHQVIQIFKCGHNSESKVVRCKKPTRECEAVFLREELEKVKALCELCGRAAERKQAEKAQAAKAVDEGYWS
ncbi:hypothetical protein BKA65DRAFT_440477 [Rhexocercosporidium sp. MPI-PUGE-AT-0058]|nr:hypothetical protein BKA65DRAFT_440477 [Rhexocercosporidium sp. MPI-PUGE-AT-0058]